MRIGTAIVALVVLAASPAQASALTMGQLVARCAQLEVSDIEIAPKSAKPMDLLDAGKCWGHFEAYIDLASTTLADPKLPNAIHPLGACVRPDSLTFRQIVVMFRGFAHAHPADLQKPAAQMVSLMLIEKYPCRQ